MIKNIAVIGIACKFPGANNVFEFRKNLINGKESIKLASSFRWEKVDIYMTPGKCGFLDDIEKFDPDFFNISDEECCFIDPQQRLYLENAFNLLQDAGYSKEKISGRNVGVFTGARQNDYLEDYINNIEFKEDKNKFFRYILLGKSQNIISARISDYFNLTGPSLTVDTACSLRTTDGGTDVGPVSAGKRTFAPRPAGLKAPGSHGVPGFVGLGRRSFGERLIEAGKDCTAASVDPAYPGAGTNFRAR